MNEINVDYSILRVVLDKSCPLQCATLIEKVGMGLGMRKKYPSKYTLYNYYYNSIIAV